jgi:hypothetical protein
MHEFKKPKVKEGQKYEAPVRRLYAQGVRFLGDIRVLFTDVKHGAYIGNNDGNGAYVWIETKVEPIPVPPGWYTGAQMKAKLKGQD